MTYDEVEKRKIENVLQIYEDYIKQNQYIEILWSEKEVAYFVTRLYSNDGENCKKIENDEHLMTILTLEMYNNECITRGLPTTLPKEQKREIYEIVREKMMGYIARLQEELGYIELS